MSSLIDVSAGPADPVAALPLASAERPIDLDHLSRMTLGERSLEREVLQLFDRQAEMLIARMQGAPAAVVGACAHTIKGSARGIGAWRVARAAEIVELAAAASPARMKKSVTALRESIREARAAIAELLRAH
jgi:HPt (histidine-containing phosphotransfer) domain-containing protein